jgi:hypothetical protein
VLPVELAAVRELLEHVQSAREILAALPALGLKVTAPPAAQLAADGELDRFDLVG